MKRILLFITFLPIVLLLIYIHQQDRFQKYPIKTLSKAILGGLLVFPLNLGLVSLINWIWVSNSIFYSSFWQAGLTEEISKLAVFLVFIWKDRGFNKFRDGVVYATFIGLTFAALKNIMYIYDWGGASLIGGTPWSGFSRAVLSVPAHFLFGVMTGFLFSLAKLNKKNKRIMYLSAGLLLAVILHTLFEWFFEAAGSIEKAIVCIIYIIAITGDIFLWIYGRRYILELLKEIKSEQGSTHHHHH